METDRQPESEDAKLCQQLEQLLGLARQLEEVTRAPEGLPRLNEPATLVVPLHESILPGSILTTLFRNPKTGRTVAFKREELAQLDDMTIDYLLKYYQSQSLYSEDDAKRLLNTIEAHTRRLHLLLRHSDWRTEVFSYQAAKEETILRSLLQLQLLIECIEILTPPMLTVKQIGGSEFDLIDDLRGFIRLLTLLMWKRLAATGVDEQAYGALAACIAGL